MKVRRLKREYRKSASTGHKALGDLLRNSKIFGGYKIYQEYPVKRINPNHKSGKHKFDWVILDLKVVIEVHGKQHYGPVNFGGRPPSESEAMFEKQVSVDKIKMQAAKEAGFNYLAIPDSSISDLTDNDLCAMLGI